MCVCGIREGKAGVSGPWPEDPVSLFKDPSGRPWGAGSGVQPSVLNAIRLMSLASDLPTPLALRGFLGVSNVDMVIGNKFSMFQAIGRLFCERACCAVDMPVFNFQ